MIAKVVIDSPLPQLDRVFEYLIPANLVEQVKAGMRVKVSVGNAKKLYEAFVISIASEPEYKGKLAPLDSIVSTLPVLTNSIFELASNLAKRQAAPIAEVLKSAIPNRAVAAEKDYVAKTPPEAVQIDLEPNLEALMVSVVNKPEDGIHPHWCGVIATKAIKQLQHGSVLICLPTENQLDQLKAKLIEMEVDFIDFASAQTPSKRYRAFLNALHGVKQLIIGNRNVLYAPVNDLAAVWVWEDSDFSHVDQSSPYLHSRDIALLRQNLSGCSLTFASIGLSADLARLVQIKFLNLRIEGGSRPKIAYEEDQQRAESLMQQTMRNALAKGPVLVQVSALGHSSALYCKTCNQKVHCKICAGPLWLDASAKPLCRWCGALNYDSKCSHCNSSQLRQGRAGATRTVAEFGKSFPGIPVYESTSQNRLDEVNEKPCIVIATPGCEPKVNGGYVAIILHDARNQLSWDSLRSVEDAVYAWNRALTQLHPNGAVVLAGVGGKLGEQYALWQQANIANDQWFERLELQLPPAIRLGSITGKLAAANQVADVAKANRAEVLGPTKIDAENVQFLMKYAYRDGLGLAAAIKGAVLKVGASKSSTSDKNARNVRIKMDDRQVI